MERQKQVISNQFYIGEKILLIMKLVKDFKLLNKNIQTV